MTEREYRLRRRIDQLSDALAESLHEQAYLLTKLGRRRPTDLAQDRCSYCGRECYGPACIAHRPLLELDPFAKASPPRALESAPRDGLGMKGV